MIIAEISTPVIVMKSFREHIYAVVHGVGSLPIVDDAYDVIMSSNGFAPGQIYPEALDEIVRLVTHQQQCVDF